MVPSEQMAVPRLESAAGRVAGVAEATAFVREVKLGTTDWKYVAVSSWLRMVFMTPTTRLARAGFEGVAAARSMSSASALKSDASVVLPTWVAVKDALTAQLPSAVTVTGSIAVIVCWVPPAG